MEGDRESFSGSILLILWHSVVELALRTIIICLPAATVLAHGSVYLSTLLPHSDIGDETRSTNEQTDM